MPVMMEKNSIWDNASDQSSYQFITEQNCL